MVKKLSSQIVYLEKIHNLRERINELEKSQTDLLRSLGNLHWDEKSYRQIVDLLPEIIFETDADYNLTFVNNRTETLLGYTSKDIKRGLKICDIIIPGENKSLVRNLDKVKSGLPQDEDVFTILSKDGRQHNLMIHIKRIDGEGGIRGIAMDITESISTDRYHPGESDLINSLLDTANCIMVCMDGNARVLVFNNECERITGYKKEEIIGTDWHSRFVPKDMWWPQEYTFAEWVKLHPRNRYEKPIITKSGELRDILWSTSVILGKGDNDLIAIAVGFDITELKKTRAALFESEQKYQLLLEQSNDAISLTCDNRFDFVNDKLVEMFGWSREELLAEDFDLLNIVAPESLRMIETRVYNFTHGIKQPSQFEFIGKRKDGVKINVDVSMSYLTIGGKAVAQGIYRDITRRKKIERELKLAHRRMEQIFKASTPMLVIDKDFIILQVNDTYEKLYHVKQEDVAGKCCYELYPGPLCHTPKCPMIKLAESPERYEYEDVTYLDDGTRIVSIVSAMPYTSDEGEFLGIVENYVDITDRKKAEKQLKEREEYYRAIWENSPVGLCLTDVDGVYHYVNKSYCRIYGYTREELIGANYRKLILAKDQQAGPFPKYDYLFKMGIPGKPGESKFIRKDGNPVWVEYSNDFVFIADKPKLMVTMNVDITKKKKAELELQESELRFKAQFKASPIPTYSWRYVGGDFVLENYNDAALKITGGGVAKIGRVKLSVLYKDRPDIIEDVHRCYSQKRAFYHEMSYNYQVHKFTKFLKVYYTYAPPDLVLVLTEDITLQRENKIRAHARINLLDKLRGAANIDECLSLACQTLYEAELFKRSVLTLHNEKREIINLGQYGFDPEVINRAAKAKAPDMESTKRMLQEQFRISKSYFVPEEAGLALDQEARYVPPLDNPISDIQNKWKSGDELFVPIISDEGRVIGWFSVDTPFDKRRPAKDTVVYLEEVTDIVLKKVQSLQSLYALQLEQEELKNKNIALKKVLEAIEEEKLDYKKHVGDTVEQILLPTLEKVEGMDGKINRAFFNILKESLGDLGVNLGKDIPIYSCLSAREAEVCQMIKTGATSKDIAKALNVTEGTVQKHREKIRKKLGISNKDINLTNYLKNL